MDFHQRDSFSHDPAFSANDHLSVPPPILPQTPLNARYPITYTPAQNWPHPSARLPKVFPQTSNESRGSDHSPYSAEGSRHPREEEEVKKPASSTKKKRGRSSNAALTPVLHPVVEDPSPAPVHGSRRKKEAVDAESPDTKVDPPSVLLREKKQKACANCRRAKLKCIVDEGESDCVRCKARTERCVFYPRTHDEDWQQTLTSDVYSAINHLSQVSSAVHHVLYHLTGQRMIPAFPGEHAAPYGLERYDPPDRDMAVLQGWGADRNRDLPSEDAKRRKRNGRSKEHDDDELDNTPDESYRRDSSTIAPISPNMQYGGYGPPSGAMRHSSFSVERLPPNGWSGPQLAHLMHHTTDSGPMIPNGMPMPPMLQHRFSAPEIPPIRSQGRGPVQLTPSSELDYVRNLGYPGQSIPPTASHSDMPPPPTPLINGHRAELSPTIVQQVTPQSIVESSPGMASSVAGLTPSDPNGTAFAGLHGVPSDHASAMSQGSQPPPTLSSEATMEGDSIEEVLGSADGRQNIITKGIVPAREALELTQYFHVHLAPFLYGYCLKLGQFPYLPEGPSAITPFILGVICLIASDHLPRFFHFNMHLRAEITSLMISSPAESWQNFKESHQARLEAQAGQAEKTMQDADEDALDPELGIGPEEIVAACVLATSLSDRRESLWMAQSAFKWARGWIKVLKGPPRYTFAESSGLVPAERPAEEADKARVWLLCYIVEGLEILQSGGPPPPRLEPSHWCHILVPRSAEPSPRSDISPHDILLTFQARLITTLRDWNHRRCEIGVSPAEYTAQAREHRRLASNTNGLLEWWREQLDGYQIDRLWTAQIGLFWLFAKVLVNEACASHLVSPSDMPMRTAAIGTMSDSAVKIFEMCAEWDPSSDILSLPPSCFWCISISAFVLSNAVKESALRGDHSCPFTPADVLPYFHTLIDILASGNLPATHPSRPAATALAGHILDLEGLL